MRDMMIHDVKIKKPETNEQGISDPVNVFTDNGLVLVAWWDERDKYWHTIDDETFGNAKAWSNINFPTGWDYDSELYGGGE